MRMNAIRLFPRTEKAPSPFNRSKQKPVHTATVMAVYSMRKLARDGASMRKIHDAAIRDPSALDGSVEVVGGGNIWRVRKRGDAVFPVKLVRNRLDVRCASALLENLLSVERVLKPNQGLF